ncbi:MAG: phosphatase PAP2 family protein, partial [Burkholderiaceae bacterium]
MQALIDYLSLTPTLALGAVFAAAFLATVGLIGTSLPGRAVVAGTGVLIGLGAIDPWWGSIAVAAGVILGDAFGYWVGRHCQDRLPTRSPRKQLTRFSPRVQKYFAERAGNSVLYRRFLSPVRAILPLAADKSGNQLLKFTPLNAFAAVAWLVAHLMTGALLGALFRLAASISSRLVLLLIVAAVVLVGLVLLLHLIWRAFAPKVSRQRDRIVGWARASSGILPRIVQSLLDPFRPESIGLLVASLMMLGGGWLFLEIVEEVVSQARLVQFDKVVFGTLQSLRTPLADHLMVVATQLGSVRVALPVIAVVAMVLALARCWRTLAYWLTAVGFAQAVVWILKTTLGRSRPIAIYDGLERFSFPSGHAASAIVLYGFLAILLGRGKPLLVRSALAATAMLLIGLIAFSRLYLGAHWFSDVAASLSLGITWVALLGIAYTQH